MVIMHLRSVPGAEVLVQRGGVREHVIDGEDACDVPAPEWAQPCHVCIETELTLCISGRTGLAPAASAPVLVSRRPTFVLNA